MGSFLKGAIDMHIHIGPDDGPRYSSSIGLARQAAASGMAGLVLKDHLTQSVQKAKLTMEVVPNIEVIGGITLNHTVGGLYPRSLLSAIKTGAKIVWMPTVDAAFCLRKAREGHWIKKYVEKKSMGYTVEGISLLDANAKLTKEAMDILHIAADHDIVLSTGHISPEECLALAEAADKIGFRKLTICHPNAWLEDFTPEILQQLAGGGAYLELSFGVCSPLHGRQHPQEIADIVKLVGVKRCIMITDYGQVESPSPVEGLRVYGELMMDCGITPDELEVMIKENPAKLLGIAAGPETSSETMEG